MASSKYYDARLKSKPGGQECPPHKNKPASENCPDAGALGVPQLLRQVVTKRSKNHAIDSVRRDAVRSRPRGAVNVGELRSELYPAPVHLILGAIVQAEPEARRAFNQRARVGGATGESARQESAWPRPGLSEATGIAEGGRSVTDVLAGRGIEESGAASVLRARVQVDVQLRSMPFQRAQPLIAPDQAESAVGTHGGVGQAASTVTADSAASEAVQSEVHVLIGERPAGIGANPATVARAVKRSDRVGTSGAVADRGGGDVFAGKCAIAEARVHTENFVVSEARLEPQFGDDVGRRIKCVGLGRTASSTACGSGRKSGDAGIVESTPRARRANQEVVCVTVGSDCSLRILHGDGEPDLVVNVLRQPQCILPCPAETGGILRVDSHGQCFAAVVHAMFGFGDQTPHLPAGETPAIVEGGLTPHLALPYRVTVALIVVRGNARRQEVSFHISRQLHVRQLPFRQQREPGLAGRSEEFRSRAGRGPGHGYRVKRRVVFGPQAPGP